MDKMRQVVLWLWYITVPIVVHSVLGDTIGLIVGRRVNYVTGRTLGYFIAPARFFRRGGLTDG